MAVHQYTRFSIDPKLLHKKAVKYVVKYLIGMKVLEIKVKIDKTKGLNACINADFTSGWSKANSDDITSLYSQIEYIIYFFGIPLA